MPRKKDDLQLYEKLKAKAKDLQAEKETTIDRIRRGFADRVIVFMDVVDSTRFKVTHASEPERWILRVKQFSELLASAVENCNGSVVKFLGDEVMAIFSNTNDAQNLVARIPEIEKNLRNATGFETRIKVAVDFGPVYELTFPGHETPDPQGLPVDRCARIAKFGLPGEVLSSQSFAHETPKLSWKKVGVSELKGLDRQTIYQLARATADIEPQVSVLKKDYETLTDERDELRTQNARLKEQNKELQQQLKDAGEQPDPDASVQDQEDDSWKPVEKAIGALKKTINGCPGPSPTYARFAFLYFSDKGGQGYSRFEERTFDELIDANLVTQIEDGVYELDPSHRRNQKLIKQLEEVEGELEDYLLGHDQDVDDLFEWSLKDPQFWEEYIQYTVT